MRHLGGLHALLVFFLATLAGSSSHAQLALVDTGIVVRPAQLSATGLTGDLFVDTLRVVNFTNAPVQISVVESLLTANDEPKARSRAAGLDISSLLKRLRPAFQRAGITKESLRGGHGTATDPAVYTTIINDERGEGILGAVDLYRVQHQTRTFLGIPYHDFRIIAAIPPDSNIVGFISIDTDQDFGTGAFPTPFGIGPTSRDIGSEREVLFDASGILVDSLLGIGRIPAGIVLSTLTDTIVGTPFLLSITRDSVFTITTTNILGLGIRADWLGDPDGKMNVGVVASRLTQGANPAPDFAPAIGHGTVSEETGVSWISVSPLSMQIPAGDSANLVVTTLAAKGTGTYGGKLALMSPGRTTVNIPVTLTVTGTGQPHIQVTPPSYSISLPRGDSVDVALSIGNTGNADLIWGIIDTSNTAWVSASPTYGSIAPGGSSIALLSLKSAGLTQGSTYNANLIVLSNDPVNNGVLFPVSLTVLPPVGVSEHESETPLAYKLYQNFPNPFNPSTVIRYDVPKAGAVTLRVFDILGRELGAFKQYADQPGRFEFTFDASSLPSGVYTYQISSGDWSATRRMIVLK